MREPEKNDPERMLALMQAGELVTEGMAASLTRPIANPGACASRLLAHGYMVDYYWNGEEGAWFLPEAIEHADLAMFVSRGERYEHQG